MRTKKPKGGAYGKVEGLLVLLTAPVKGPVQSPQRRGEAWARNSQTEYKIGVRNFREGRKSRRAKR